MDISTALKGERKKKMDPWVCSLKATHVWRTDVCHRRWHSTFGSHYSTVSLSIHSIIVQLDASDGPSSRDKMIVRHLATEIPASKETRFRPTASCWPYLLFLLPWPNLGNFFFHISGYLSFHWFELGAKKNFLRDINEWDVDNSSLIKIISERWGAWEECGSHYPYMAVVLKLSII